MGAALWGELSTFLGVWPSRLEDPTTALGYGRVAESQPWAKNRIYPPKNITGDVGLAHVLVVKGDTVVRAILARDLERQGHDCQVAGNGREALQKIASGSFDLIFTAINMPDMNGIELIRAVRELGSPVPIVAISGERVDTPQELGTVEVITEPFNLVEIREVVGKLLGSP
jgi:CheY-like chemotaxis protein